jgi:hypothetical protein
MLRRIPILLLVAVCAAPAQKYSGPRPPMPDLPYLKHAEDLLPTEATEAKEEKGKKGRKDDLLYIVTGPNSSAKTPLASPVFLFQSDKLAPDKLQLFKLESKNGRREILFGPKKRPQPIRLDVTRLDGNLYRIEAAESLERGEYSITPEGSNQVFCFQVF